MKVDLMGPLLLSLCIVPLVPVALYGYICADRILKEMYERYNDEWVNRGKPIGMFWRPPGHVRVFRISFAWTRAIISWIFKTPIWAKGDGKIATYIIRMRICVLIWNVGCVVVIALIVALYGFPPGIGWSNVRR